MNLPPPNLTELITQFKSCSPTAGSAWNRVKLNDDTRFNRWADQWPDGKKHNTTAKTAFPWDGASDIRYPVADGAIESAVAESWEAFMRAMLAPKAGQSLESNYAVKLLDYLVNTQMKDQLFDEVELSEQYRQTYGWVVLHPTWEVELGLEYRTVSMDDLIGAAQAAQQQLGQAQNLEPVTAQNVQQLINLPNLIQDPSAEEEAVKLLGQIYGHYARAQGAIAAEIEVPPVRPARLRSAVVELRQKGTTDLPVPYICKNQPAIYALKPWDEIFLHGDSTDVQRAVLFRRVCMTELEVKAAALTHEWPQKWIDEAVKLKGKVSVWSAAMGNSNPPVDLATAMTSGPTAWTEYDTQADQIEVIYATYKQLDEDGVPGVYVTVFHPSIAGQAAEHTLLDYGRGKLPYVAGTRERWHRAIAASRGLPEIIGTCWQRPIKVHHDAVIDYTSISVLPPINTYENSMGTKYVLGPAVQNTVRMGKEPKFADVPNKGVPFAFESMTGLRRDLDEYLGRDNPMLPVGHGQSKRQMRAGKFLLMWSAALQMVLDLCQECMEDAEFARVTGAEPGWLDANRKRRNLLSARLEFDIRELSPEYVQSQLAAINSTVLPGDVAGVTNRAAWTKIQWRMINPSLARELVSDPGEASQQLYEKVNQDIALMALGNEARYVEMDPTAQQKLQYASQIVGANPNYQKALQQPESRFAELMKKYAMNLQFSLTEEQNKQVGAIGVRPGGQPSTLNSQP